GRGDRLRHLPRSDRHDGGGDADAAALDELVPGLPPRSGTLPPPGLGGHQHEVDPPQGLPRARRGARAGAPGASAGRLLGVPPVTKTYWRSLGQLADSPEFRSRLEREFPEGASELPEGISRREMITLLGASLSLAGLAGCRRPEEHIVPFVNAPEEI